MCSYLDEKSKRNSDKVRKGEAEEKNVKMISKCEAEKKRRKKRKKIVIE